MADPTEVRRLEELSAEMRRMLMHLCGHYDGNVHIGGDLSMTELLISLYHYGMDVDPTDFRNPDAGPLHPLEGSRRGRHVHRDRLSRGYFDFDEIVATYGRLDSAYGMHPCKIQLPGVESSTGSLGHGLALSVGLALAGRQTTGTPSCVLPDGRWRDVRGHGVGSGQHRRLVRPRATSSAVIDRNKQMMSSMEGDAIDLEPYPDKWRAFNWDVVEVDGHDLAALIDTLDGLPAVDHWATIHDRRRSSLTR